MTDPTTGAAGPATVKAGIFDLRLILALLFGVYGTVTSFPGLAVRPWAGKLRRGPAPGRG
ncbi:hypothetical protein OG618_35470 [Kitasatospora sp. NBC_01246]|uniref:hypothetical protein n=1 Tax=Kitasatospora sp. NBC_01246 TaxID=2903570 RepID=UPI002E3358F4|nr:hypothetical protein [Kitasatospora sp. NBC_01246]